MHRYHPYLERRAILLISNVALQCFCSLHPYHQREQLPNHEPHPIRCGYGTPLSYRQ